MSNKIEVEIGPNLNKAIERLLASVDNVNNGCSKVVLDPAAAMQLAFGINITQMIESRYRTRSNEDKTDKFIIKHNT